MEDSLFMVIGLFTIILLFFIGWAIYVLMYGKEHYGAAVVPKTCDPEKIWIHRVGFDIDRFIRLQDDYSGFEMDIVYDSNLKDFVVSHDLDYEMYKDKILLLSDFYKDIYNKRAKVWLDIKNASLDTYKEITKILKDIVGEDIDKMYIELYSDQYVINRYMQKNGFKIIYNLSDPGELLTFFHIKRDFEYYSIDFANYVLFSPALSLIHPDVKFAIPFSHRSEFIDYIHRDKRVDIILVNKWLEE